MVIKAITPKIELKHDSDAINVASTKILVLFCLTIG